MVRVCVIRKRGAGDVMGPQLPEFMVEPQCTFTTEFFISGVAPLRAGEANTLQLVLLGCGKAPDEEGNASRPTLQVVQPTTNDYIEVNLCWFLKAHSCSLLSTYHTHDAFFSNCVIMSNFFFF